MAKDKTKKSTDDLEKVKRKERDKEIERRRLEKWKPGNKNFS